MQFQAKITSYTQIFLFYATPIYLLLTFVKDYVIEMFIFSLLCDEYIAKYFGATPRNPYFQQLQILDTHQNGHFSNLLW